jgi:hypothetical protein
MNMLSLSSNFLSEEKVINESALILKNKNYFLFIFSLKSSIKKATRLFIQSRKQF